jgi:hypothetical protein
MLLARVLVKESSDCKCEAIETFEYATYNLKTSGLTIAPRISSRFEIVTLMATRLVIQNSLRVRVNKQAPHSRMPATVVILRQFPYLRATIVCWMPPPAVSSGPFRPERASTIISSVMGQALS